VKPIGVPGAASPSQMAKPEHKRYFTPSPQPSPQPLRKGDRAASSARLAPGEPGYQQVVNELRQRSEKEFDIGEELSGYGLQGVKVTEDDLLALVEELGLEGKEAGDLAKGLSAFTGQQGIEKGSTNNKPGIAKAEGQETKEAMVKVKEMSGEKGGAKREKEDTEEVQEIVKETGTQEEAFVAPEKTTIVPGISIAPAEGAASVL
jgi:hypothetical protein